MQKCDKCNGAGVTGLEAGAWGQQSVAIGPQKPDAIGPAVPTGSTAFIFEIAALNADNDRLRRELEEARAELAHMRPVVAAVVEYVSSGMRERWPVLRAVQAYRCSAGKEGE